MQADPIIQDPLNSQSLNRYAYTINSPLNATDPSGYSWRKYVGAVVAIVLTIVFPPSGPWGAALIGGVSGAVGAAANGGNIFKGAFTGAVTGAAFYGVGAQYGGGVSPESVLAYGVVGGITSILQGGKFGHGFLSAGIGAIAGGAKWLRNRAIETRTIIKAVIGGTVSELTGGKFANGALTATFSEIISDTVKAIKSSGEVDLYDPKTETGPEFDFETRKALEKALRSDFSKIGSTISAAESGDKTALSKIKEFWGDVDLKRLRKEFDSLYERSGEFEFHSRIRKMFSTDKNANGRTGGYFSPNNGNIYLSKTLVGNVLSGTGSLRFGLFHEITHYAGFDHTDYTSSDKSIGGVEFARRNRFDVGNYRDPYAYQGLLESL